MRLTADEHRRTMHGLALPWDEVGYTSAGPVTAPRGTVTLPADPSRVKLYRDHDRTQPVAVASALEDTETGIEATFTVPPTPDGDRALLEARHGIRDCLSVELEAVEVADGALRAGTLVGLGQVPIGAYPSAYLAAAWNTSSAPAGADPTPAPAGDPTPPEVPAMTDTLTAADPAPAAPSVPAPAHLTAAPATTRPRSALLELAGRLCASRLEGQGAMVATLTAALADITPAGNGAGNAGAGLGVQAMGELWSGVGYESKYRTLIGGGNLTGYEVSGWVWTVPPTVADYAGNKGAVPSNTATLALVKQTAQRVAGAHDLDRIYVDLGGPDILASYWRRMAESVAIAYDAKALDTIETAAGTADTASSVDDALIKGVLAVSPVAIPTFALVSADLAEAAATSPSDTAPLALVQDSVLGITIPPITATPDLPANTVIVGARSVATLLTIDPPVRVEAVNIPNGGVDAGVFGYWAALIENAAAVANYTVTTTP